LPNIPFDFFFMDDAYDSMYKAEVSMSKIITWFTGFAILTACLGLLGLISFIAAQRTREIGIRKVLGASIGSVTALLAKDFFILVVLGNILAWVPAWYLLNEWLSGFAYRINLGWQVFLSAAVVALILAMGTVSYRAVKAGMANPVKTLRQT
jgi:putative ABC transport system permease protein